MPDSPLHIGRAEVIRLLGYGRRALPSPRVDARLSDLWGEALGLLRPSGTWRVVGGESAADAGMPRPSATVAVGLATIGPGLEAEAARRSESGSPLDALILDTIGSVAAEAAADGVNMEVCEEARRRGLHAAARVSPGYGAWDVAFQQKLLALLPAQEIGVRLTPGMMMVPRKSVSFAVNLLETPPQGRGAGSKCARCGLESCPYRE